VASDDLPGTVRELMVVEYPSGTHLSQSRTSGGISPLARDDDNALVTHAVLFPTDDDTTEAAGVAAAWVTVGIAVGIVAVKAAPRVKRGFKDLKSRLNRKSEGTVEDAVQEATSEQSDMGRDVAPV
jgi:hypothetical protein